MQIKLLKRSSRKSFAILSIFCLVLLFGLSISNTLYVEAQPDPSPFGEYEPLEPLSNTLTNQSVSTNLAQYARGLFGLLIGVAAGLAVIMIIIGGIQYMSTDAISGKSEGKEKIRQALYGLLLAMASWLILFTINPELLDFGLLNSIPQTPVVTPTNTGSTTPPSVAQFVNTPNWPGWYVRQKYQCEYPPDNSGPHFVYYGPLEEERCRYLLSASFQEYNCYHNPSINMIILSEECVPFDP